MKLMLCAGRTRRDGWITLDANVVMEPDILATIPPLPAEVRGQQWDEIELIHGIGSFYPWEAEALLRELRDTLAPGGTLVLEQPNAANCDPIQHPEFFFGDPAFKNPLHMNRWAYTPDSLRELLQRCGYSSVVHAPAQHHVPSRDFRMVARP